MRSVIFDTETTDLLKAEANDISEQPYIIEIAVIVFEDDGKKFPVVDEYSALIKPPIAIPEKITQITKISEDDVKDKGPFIDIYHDLCTLFLGCNRVIGHNLSFDRSMLANELIRIDKLINFPWPPIHICTVETSTPIKGYRLSLDKLYELATGKDITGWHRALGDTQHALECYKWLRTKKNLP